MTANAAALRAWPSVPQAATIGAPPASATGWRLEAVGTKTRYLAIAPANHSFGPSEPPGPVVERSDAELVREYLATYDSEPFEEILRRYQSRIVQVLVGLLGCEARADEIAQRAFVKAAFRMHQLHDPVALYAWLLRIARKAALDELGRSGRKRRSNEETGDLFAMTRSPNHAVRNLVRRALSELPFPDREVLLLADFERRSISELARHLDISVSAAKMRTGRARRRFRRLYDQFRWLEHRTAKGTVPGSERY